MSTLELLAAFCIGYSVVVSQSSLEKIVQEEFLKANSFERLLVEIPIVNLLTLEWLMLKNWLVSLSKSHKKNQRNQRKVFLLPYFFLVC